MIQFDDSLAISSSRKAPLREGRLVLISFYGVTDIGKQFKKNKNAQQL